MSNLSQDIDAILEALHNDDTGAPYGPYMSTEEATTALTQLFEKRLVEARVEERQKIVLEVKDYYETAKRKGMPTVRCKFARETETKGESYCRHSGFLSGLLTAANQILHSKEAPHE